jgi:hypothetical protein
MKTVNVTAKINVLCNCPQGMNSGTHSETLARRVLRKMVADRPEESLMRTVLFLNNLILIFALLQSNGNNTAGNSANPTAEQRAVEAIREPRKLTVTLRTATETTITFRAEHNEEVIAPEPEGQKIPHLVLNRNGVPTPGFERTLIVSLDNIEVPSSGAYAHLTIETQHGDPDLGGGKSNRIKVWDDTRFIPYSGESDQLTSVDFRVDFQRTFKHLQKELRTPTDYFSYRIRLLDAKGNLLKEFRDEYAFLMENQWRVPLPKVLEATPGAAPSELVIYYYDMIPFQTDLRDPYTQIARYDVERYIQTELVPAMVDAFKTQTNLWELPWYEEWSNYRPDEDPKTLSVALMEYGTWFHGSAPSLGHAMISIRVDGSFGEYSDLTDGIMSVFHHELFHNQQRNLSLHFGSNGNLSGKEEAWKLFSEGTAVLASSVGQPMVQFEPTTGLRSYLKRANAFIGSDGVFGGGLNKSYRNIPYHTALYWRFLYENCGGIDNGVEDPAAGMKVIRNILEALYKGEIASINSSTDVAHALPHIVDSALQVTASCPFDTYEESLIQFARAIYMLRLEDGRCSIPENPASCGFYDPNRLYTSPHADTYVAAAGSTLINGSIPSSYGIDLMELSLDPSAHGKSLRIILRATSTPQDEFQVELHGVNILNSDAGIERFPAQTGVLRSGQTENGQLVLEIPSLDTGSFNGLGMIIVRTDPYENSGSPGNYAIQLLVE